MSWLYGIGITVGLMSANYALLFFCETLFRCPKEILRVLEMVLGAATIFGSAYWVKVDSAKIEVSKYEGIVQGTPEGLAIITCLLWPLVFPSYLQKRWMIKNRRVSMKPEFHPNYRKPS